MARWLSFFAEYNFIVHYKPGKNNILADALSRRPGYDPRVVLGRQVIEDEDDSDEHCAVCAASGINVTSVSPEMDLRDEIAAAYADDASTPTSWRTSALPATRHWEHSRAIHATRLTATISTVTCCATTSIVSMLHESSCPTTTIYGPVLFMSFTTAAWAHTWAARRPSRRCPAIFTGPVCISGFASGSALVRPANG
ncbi:unnamed protein product [Phytophthora fragariaefolia]|uniref:Unnamed protein product n=1 Tax=Phytophthora fragariaefolia TaxID=1490495 RepID=A0A9W7D4H8_9STRA|nr:unnamed protein product [Phytophthora fragariaefolia]